MATGDILLATVYRWYIELLIEGLSSSGTYDTGYVDDNAPIWGDGKLTLTRTNETFTGLGIATTKQTQLYNTKYKRQDVPNQLLADETISGLNVIIRIALSDEIYTGDTAITIDVDADLYTQGGTGSNAVSGLSVTNSSTRGYYPPVPNFTRFLHGRIMGFDDINIAEVETNFEVRAMAYHRDGKVPVIKIVAVGRTSLHSETIYLTDDEIEQTSYNDLNPIIERIGNIPITGFTQGELVDIDLVAYPCIGDASVVVDSSTLGRTMPTHELTTHTVVCDKSHTYGITTAVIDSVSGDNGTGVVVDFGSFNPLSPPLAFADAGAAATAIRAYNLANHSRDNHGGGLFLFQAGDHGLTTTTTTGSTGDAFIVMTPFPGVDPATVHMNAQNDWVSDKTKYHKLWIDLPLGSTLWSNEQYYLWWSECDVTSLPSYHSYKAGALAIFTGSDISSCPQKFRPGGAGGTYHILVGNNIHDISSNINVISCVLLGNYMDGDFFIRDGYPGLTVPYIRGALIAQNRIKKTADGTDIIHLGDNVAGNVTEGDAVVNNILEKPTSGSSPIFWIAGDETEQYNVDNMIIWNNVILGQRSNLAYNDYTLEGVGPAPRDGWSIKGNFFDDLNVITDTSSHGGSPSSDKNGNLSIIHGCGLASNWYADNTVLGYMPEFIGVNAVYDYQGDPGFVDYAAGYGTGLGDGDYHLEETSPMIAKRYELLNTFDLDEVSRAVTGSSGAYEFVSSGVPGAISMIYRRFLGGIS